MNLHYRFLISLIAPWATSSFQIPVPSLSLAPRHASASAVYMAEDPTRVSIEYCTGCRWMLKSFWMAQELLTTFEDELDAITVVPSSSKGIYSVKLNGSDLLWDRKEKGGFPSTKVLKQLFRDKVTPEKYLGHSDTEERQGDAPEGIANESVEFLSRGDEDLDLTLSDSEAPLPAITITYCTGCRWMLRAAYFGQELLTTFGEDLKSVTLVPSKPPAKGGQFSIKLDGECLFDRATEGRFPEVKEIKQQIRDKLVPDKDLGHSDVHYEKEVDEVDDDELDDDEAAEARNYFGVA